MNAAGASVGKNGLPRANNQQEATKRAIAATNWFEAPKTGQKNRQGVHFKNNSIN